MIIDAHHHFWDRSQPFEYGWLDTPELEAINRNFLPADLQPQLAACGISQSIFVQTQHNLEEARWVLSMRAEWDFLAGVVGWVDLRSPECESQLEMFADQEGFLGIRHVVQDEPDDEFIIQPETLRGLKVLERYGVPYDLLFYDRHLRHAATVADAVPNLPLVLDHLSKPRIKDGAIDEWARELRQAAQRPNLYAKLSGLITEADWKSWSVDHLRPYVEVALEAFGPQRLMYGSDWPVCELAGSYAQVFEAAKTLIADLSPEEQAKIWSGTAQSFYNL